jgi:hypothetical protein
MLWNRDILQASQQSILQQKCLSAILLLQHSPEPKQASQPPSVQKSGTDGMLIEPEAEQLASPYTLSPGL